MISKKKRKKDTKLINDKKIIISIINISNYLLYYCVILFKILKFYEIYKSFYIIDTSIVFMIVILSLFLNIFTVTFETEWSSNCTCALLRQLNYEVLEVINEDLDIIYIHLFLNKKNHNISKYNIIFTNYSI